LTIAIGLATFSVPSFASRSRGSVHGYRLQSNHCARNHLIADERSKLFVFSRAHTRTIDSNPQDFAAHARYIPLSKSCASVSDVGGKSAVSFARCYYGTRQAKCKGYANCRERKNSQFGIEKRSLLRMLQLFIRRPSKSEREREREREKGREVKLKGRLSRERRI